MPQPLASGRKAGRKKEVSQVGKVLKGEGRSERLVKQVIGGNSEVKANRHKVNSKQ